jgi:hypothetical protein
MGRLGKVIGDLPLIITISDTWKNQPKRLDSDNTINLSSLIVSLGEFVRLLFLQAHRETDRFFAASGVQLAQTQRVMFHFLRSVFSAQIKAKVGSTLVKTAALRTNIHTPTYH